MKNTAQNIPLKQTLPIKDNVEEAKSQSDGMEDGEPPYDPLPTVKEEVEMMQRIRLELDYCFKILREDNFLVLRITEDTSHPAYKMAMECLGILCDRMD